MTQTEWEQFQAQDKAIEESIKQTELAFEKARRDGIKKDLGDGQSPDNVARVWNVDVKELSQ